MNQAVQPSETKAVPFGAWLDECRQIIAAALRCDTAKANAMVLGAGIAIYRKKFDRGLTPQECVNDEFSVFNE
jgi:hypothetical protein